MERAKAIVKNGKNTPNGREQVVEVHLGEKGKGKQIGASVVFWPWSSPSVEKAWDIVSEIARDNDLELVHDSEE